MWRSTLWMNLINDESSTIYKLKKKRKEKRKRTKNVKKYLRLRMQKIRSALNVLHEMLCLSQSKQSSFLNSFIISRKHHHFSMRREISMTRALDASFRWRELSRRTSPWSKDEWDIRHISEYHLHRSESDIKIRTIRHFSIEHRTKRTSFVFEDRKVEHTFNSFFQTVQTESFIILTFQIICVTNRL